MRRALAQLEQTEYDLVVVGGGIFGIAVAWDAVLRGLSVALLERRDFSHGASANCFKVVHGGIRYLQHLDLVRTRESAAERRAFLRVAPHQVRPLPILMPTYGHGMKGKEILGAGMKVYDLVTADCNRGLRDPERRIPATRLLSRAETLDAFPQVSEAGLTGGALFHDAQMYSPARLALSFLLSATEAGVEAANYLEATRLLRRGSRVVGVAARDTLSDQELEVRGRVVVNATGGWAPHWLDREEGAGLAPRPSYSRDAYFLVRRRLCDRMGLAFPGQTSDPDAVLSRSARHLFLMPWRDRTLVGVWHVVWTDDPDRVHVGERDLEAWLAELNASLPGLSLSRDDVELTHCGLVLFGENEPGATNLRYAHRSLLVDHGESDGLAGLISLLGVRYTTARLDAARAVDRVCRQLGRHLPRPDTARRPVYGGDIETVAGLAREAAAAHAELEPEVRDALLRNHGSQYARVLAGGDGRERIPGTATLAAEVLHAVREEMASKLSDVVFRRTDLGTAGRPGSAALEATADLMASELGWERARREKELEEVCAAYPPQSGPPVAEGASA